CTIRASSDNSPPSVRASSVDLISLDRSGFRMGRVLRRFGDEAGLGRVKVIRALTGSSSGLKRHFDRASTTAAFTASRHGFTFALDSTSIPRPDLDRPTNLFEP